MKLTQTALDQINTPKIRVRLAQEMGTTEQTIIRYIRANKDDLTKAAALKVIREELNMDDSEILEEAELMG